MLYDSLPHWNYTFAEFIKLCPRPLEDSIYILLTLRLAAYCCIPYVGLAWRWVLLRQSCQEETLRQLGIVERGKNTRTNGDGTLDNRGRGQRIVLWMFSRFRAATSTNQQQNDGLAAHTTAGLRRAYATRTWRRRPSHLTRRTHIGGRRRSAAIDGRTNDSTICDLLDKPIRKEDILRPRRIGDEGVLGSWEAGSWKQGGDERNF